MAIKKSNSNKQKFVLTSPKTGKVLAKGTKTEVTKRAGQIAYFKSQKKK